MEKQEYKSKWDDLAREIGAEIPLETQQREEAVASATNDASSTPPIESDLPSLAARAPLPKRAAADWDSLAGELGLPPTEPPPRTVNEDRPELARDEAPRARQTERPQRGHRESVEKRRESSSERREPIAKRRPERTFDADSAVDSPGKVAQEEVKKPTPPPARPRDEQPSTAVSLWHKIFGSPAQQTAKLSEISSEVSEAPETDQAADVRSRGHETTEIRSFSGEDVTAAPFVDELDRRPEEALDTDEAPRRDRGRGRPRRRRRGRGCTAGPRDSEHRRAPRDPSGSARVEDDSDIDDELHNLETDDDIVDTELPIDSEDGNGAADGSEVGAVASNRAKAAQRTIPSWEEAIGFIVDSNMHSRSQRRPPSRADSRGKPSRGRPRGRKRN